MSFIVTMGNGSSTDIECLFGSTFDFKPFNLDISLASDEQKNICNNFFTLVGNHASVYINNSPYDFNDFNYIIVGAVESDIVNIDYSVLSPDNKNIIDEMNNLINSLVE